MVGYPKAAINETKAQDVEWFATDVGQAAEAAGEARKVRIYYTTSLAVLIEYTLDSGSTWKQLELLSAVDTYKAPVYIPIRDGDLFNMRHGTAATTPTVVCRVDIVTEGD